MTVDVSAETKQQLEQRLATGRYTGPDELIRVALVALDEKERDVQWLADLRESLAEMEAGQTMPVSEAFDDVRREQGWKRPARAPDGQVVEAIREGVEDARAGRSRSVDEVFDGIERKYPNLKT
jgi:predicted transcriptional regulator